MSTTACQPGEQSDALCDVLRALASGAAPSTNSPAGGRRPSAGRPVEGVGQARSPPATGGSSSAYERLVADALAAGMSAEEIVDVLIEVAATVGLARLVPAAVELASALGYDVDRALEGTDDVHDEE